METLNRKLIFLIPVSAVLFGLFFIGGPGYHSARSYQHFWDLGHIFFFAILTFIILSLLDKGWNTIKINLEEIATAPKTRQMNLSQIRRATHEYKRGGILPTF
jgi:hypothetical protein